MTYGEQNPYQQRGYGQGYGYGHGYGRRVPLWQRFRGEEWPTLRELLAPARGAIRGCVLLPLLFCLWPFLLFLGLYPMARSARRLARRVFVVPGPRGITDHVVLRVQRIRGWLALAAGFAVLAVYGTPDDWSEANDQFQLRLTITPWLVLVTAPAVVGVLFRLAGPAARPAMRAQVRPAVLMALQYVGACTAVPVLLWLAAQARGMVQVLLVGNLFDILVLAAPIWALMFVAFASPTVVRTAFTLDRVHAVFPPVLTGVLVWELAVIGLLFGGLPPGPLPVELAAVVGGPATVTAVAWWEVRRLRTHFGVTLRGAAGAGGSGGAGGVGGTGGR
ncbi:hypothetical protein GCM10018790_34260 [Kitasatospora xanthocidica]|uniref:hypothetical protein n=1 Tax=Kitasatospora xanthocidica TaxID=83382 RepID=UPI0019C80A03|nr:hypothetical protein [Kitasatospora xanthocidica]GHF53614.1 hypothetical protein GCM10018790_34260 [Kitasatospora xanthocidica]